MKSLMSLLDSSQGRFVEIGNGAFIELTQPLKKQLEELRIISEGNRVYHLGAGALQNLIEETYDVRPNRSSLANLH